MGIFDTDLGTPFTDDFRENNPYTLEDMRLGPVINTSFGEARVVFLTINGKRYSVFGNGLVNMARNATHDDFPAEVMMVRQDTKDGRQQFKTIVPYVESDVTPRPAPSGGNNAQGAKQADDDIPF